MKIVKVSKKFKIFIVRPELSFKWIHWFNGRGKYKYVIVKFMGSYINSVQNGSLPQS